MSSVNGSDNRNAPLAAVIAAVIVFLPMIGGGGLYYNYRQQKAALQYDTNTDGVISGDETVNALTCWGLQPSQMINTIDFNKRWKLVQSTRDNKNNKVIADMAMLWSQEPYIEGRDDTEILNASFEKIVDVNDDDTISLEEATEVCRFGEYEPLALKNAADKASKH